MKVVAVYLRLYADCLDKAFKGITKSPWTLLLPVGMLFAWQLLLARLAGIPFLGAIIMSGFLSCYLYFVGEVVAQSRVSLAELRASIVKYIWSVLNVMFVIWIANLLLSLMVARSANAGVFYLLFQLALFILLNPTPEVIYLRGTYGGLATLERSFRFIQENWIEWYLPNLALGAAAYFGMPLFLQMGLPGLLLYNVVGGALFHVAMVFRGHLFEALDGTTHRQRMYRYRMGM